VDDELRRVVASVLADLEDDWVDFLLLLTSCRRLAPNDRDSSAFASFVEQTITALTTEHGVVIGNITESGFVPWTDNPVAMIPWIMARWRQVEDTQGGPEELVNICWFSIDELQNGPASPQPG
jgi:hypothetical protein